MSEIAIKVSNLSKRYRIGLKEEIHDTFVSSLTAWLKSPISNYRRVHNLSSFSVNGESDDSDDIIWALKNVSLNVKRGEVIGIIGDNGAGKTTLLKILSRITEPTSGYAEINGSVASLLEVGTGFHPELTGRENLYLNGAILGMKRDEINRKFDEIVDFSGVDKFIDTPVKRYSSGMRVRLAFSVAAHLESEILLVDEVLAVGDIDFQNKCIKKMDSLSHEGRTVLLVSHNMSSIQRLCEKALLMRGGKIFKSGKTRKMISTYYDSIGLNESKFIINKKSRDQTKRAFICNIELFDYKGISTAVFNRANPFQVKVEYEVIKPTNNLSVVFSLWAMGNVMVCKSFNIDNEKSVRENYDPGTYVSKVEFPGKMLNFGIYTFDIMLRSGRNTLFFSEKLNFTLTDSSSLPSTARTPKFSDKILLSLPLKWHTEKI